MKEVIFEIGAVTIFGLTIFAIVAKVPSLEVKLDRNGHCQYVTDFKTGKKQDCGFEKGRRYTTSY